MFKKYHMHTVRSLHEAKAIRSLVGDIDKAKKTTCARDDYRAFASNVSCSPKSFVPYRGEDYPIKNVAALLLEVKNGDKNSMLTTAHKAHLAHYAPAIAKRAAEFRGW